MPSYRLDYPRPRKITGFNGQHQVKSGRVVIVDAQTFLIPSFNYDGQAPDAHFWVGTGERPGPEGMPKKYCCKMIKIFKNEPVKSLFL